MVANRINVVVNPKKTVLVNQSGLIAIRKIVDLADVDVSANEDGAILIYDATQEKFVASRILNKQIIDGGLF